MGAKWTSYFKLVAPEPETARLQDSQDMTGGASYGNYSWYQRLVQGSSTRVSRYKEYDLMDNDVEVARALDTIAEEMTGNNSKTDLQFNIDLQAEENQKLPETLVMTLRAAIRHWSTVHDWENRLFKVARNTIKYGDTFFLKHDPHKRWEYMHPKNVIAAIVDIHDASRVVGYQIRSKRKEVNRSTVGHFVNADSETDTAVYSSDEVVRFTLNDDMSDMSPFGDSILRSVYRAHKQKELLEDAIIIYRVQRAPERRVFYIDVGKMPPPRVKMYLEQMKNEIRQKKIPSVQGGKDTVESVYNPQSMTEDFFFATRPDGRGSRVETLPGGQGLGELADLEYFQNKVFRGLRIPISYTKSGQDSGTYSDGKVGIAYIEELRFALYVMRLQGYIEKVIDEEFKKYLKTINITVDDTLYRIRLPEPTNFGIYRQQEVDGALLTSYSSADNIPYLSKRFILSRYLQLTDDEISTNEMLLKEERGITNGKDIKALYTSSGETSSGLDGGLESGVDNTPEEPIGDEELPTS